MTDTADEKQRLKARELNELIRYTMWAVFTVTDRDALDAQVATETAKKPGIRTSTADAQPDAAAAMATLGQLADDQKSIGQLDHRLQIAKDLDVTYGKWILLVQARERTALREMLLSIVVVLILGIVMLIANSYVARYFRQLAPERRRLRTRAIFSRHLRLRRR